MSLTQKEISYTTTNSYSTLNTLTHKTKNVWFVCHGMNYLSRYFLKYFDELDAEENYIIAPQAQSKFYLAPKFKHVGASWLTKENTLRETENVMRYFDEIFKAENITKNVNLIILGYSQGVSVAMRYISKREIQCSQLILLSGGIPKELIRNDFLYLKNTTIVSLVYGTHDEYLNEERMHYEKGRINELFDNNVNIIQFDGKHEIKKEIINNFI
ncbi:MAG: esterase [Bacteroidetes bacterium]|nr:esterase [Bacteroidota bacterium]